MNVIITIKVIAWEEEVRCEKGHTMSTVTSPIGGVYWCTKCDAGVPYKKVAKAKKRLMGKGYSRGVKI